MERRLTEEDFWGEGGNYGYGMGLSDGYGSGFESGSGSGSGSDSSDRGGSCMFGCGYKSGDGYNLQEG